MPDLIARGSDSIQRWSRPIPEGALYVIGRDPSSCSVGWDDLISRRHVEVRCHKGILHVQKLAAATNPVFYRGRDCNQFSLSTGEHFVIGSTSFFWAESDSHISIRGTPAVTEQTFPLAELQRVRFGNADQRIDALSRLPEMVAGVSSETELFVRLVNVILAAVPESADVAVVSANAPEQVKVLHWDRRRADGAKFSASDRLILKAVESAESVVHIWEATPRDGDFTQADNMDWAYCVPLRGDACPGWAIYVAGCFAKPAAGRDPQSLRDDVKFTELCAATLQHHYEIRQFERRQASLRPFFSPVVLAALADQEPERLLEPKESNVTVLFCDLRGFSRRSEQSADDLMELLNRVSQALGIMTHHILDEGGVVGDFHGDAAMGFWGWPIPADDDVRRACRAALGIRAAFETAGHENDALAGFKAGIGIATGKAVAGGIGTVDQIKVTVFGPVVNLASRLEGLTRQLQADVLIDESTADWIRANVPTDVARLRRVARVRPFGITRAEDVHELLPPYDQHPILTDNDIAVYESAVTALVEGRWDEAFTALHQVPAVDRVKDFLTVYIAQHNRTPPTDWDGVIAMDRK
jgi:adenylate cyclase